MHPDAQHASEALGVFLLLACGVLFPKRRGCAVIAPVLIGLALGAAGYPFLLGLVLGCRSAAEGPARLFWSTFRDVGSFYALAPVTDTVPRGAVLGLLLGLVVGLRRAGRRDKSRRPGILAQKPDA